MAITSSTVCAVRADAFSDEGVFTHGIVSFSPGEVNTHTRRRARFSVCLSRRSQVSDFSEKSDTCRDGLLLPAHQRHANQSGPGVRRQPRCQFGDEDVRRAGQGGARLLLKLSRGQRGVHVHNRHAFNALAG